MEPDLVHAPRETVQAVREANFAATLGLVFRGHPHYRRRFAEFGLPARAAAQVKLAIGVTPKVAPDAVYDAEGAAKAKRLVDRRGA